eukprot:354232-Chlamydomonas_euryale.AAC.1
MAPPWALCMLAAWHRTAVCHGRLSTPAASLHGHRPLRGAVHTHHSTACHVNPERAVHTHDSTAWACTSRGQPSTPTASLHGHLRGAAYALNSTAWACASEGAVAPSRACHSTA